ncbi:hypothetical protein D3C78_1347190 [compost metagenome]
MALEGAEQQVVGHAHAGEQFALLRHQAETAADQHLHLRHGLQAAVEAHLAARAEHAHDRRQHGGLAGAVGADDGNDLPFADAQAGVAQRLDLAVGNAEGLDLQQRLGDLILRLYQRIYLHIHHSAPPR